MKFLDVAKIHRGLKYAFKASKNSSHDTFKIGAAILRKNKFLSCGFNEGVKSNTYVAVHGVFPDQKGGTHVCNTIHAELAAIFKVKNKESLRGAVIYTYRQTKNGELGNSRPCNMCYNLIRESGIKKIVYTTNQGILEEVIKSNR